MKTIIVMCASLLFACSDAAEPSPEPTTDYQAAHDIQELDAGPDAPVVECRVVGCAK